MPVKYDATFYKTGEMVFISHLDLMTLMRRAVRRASLPFVITGGFTPRVKISLPMALKLGASSDNEQVTLFLTEEREENEIKELLNSQLPEGIKLTKVNKKG